jgi:nicotinamide-nucleotide amidase
MTVPVQELAAGVGRALAERGWRLATAESCTGGLVSGAVTDVAGSSGWFDRGFVTYSNEAKVDLLGVRPETLARFGAVSEATVREMAEGALERSRADIAVAVTGVAGPAGGAPEKPVGLVWFAWAVRDGSVESESHHFPGRRAEVREASVVAALAGLLERARDG